eukprot:TRINITY_DN6050_c0_g1_i7.p1 TRINITY_DN6050_c0_g1~~TRINITY_DN6050_c0_g1_i7.p1  ORF type:complete len:1110 (+),score=245.64 TRINITY_DN6050_c0_g1_i7:298-3627(+)
MAGSASGANVVGGSSEEISNGQHFRPEDSLAEWRSCEQLETSTSPPYWDTDADDGPKPSELYGKFTWKIENFSQINKRELRSNAFDVGGYKWYILIYPQGCDVCNHLSLFLCVANHDKLLPGWGHFAQFTIAVVNKDPKKSKYSDTLHRFWKKEHDWGWKRFMELSKVYDGFIISDTLVIKAQVQVIREKAHRPLRCLDCQYRRELVRVYQSNVELICRRCVEEKRDLLTKLIEDKVRWSSFRAFWYGIDQNARCRMSRDKMDTILKKVVKNFFIEKEVTSTLVMDSLSSGLKVLEHRSENKKGRAKLVTLEETPAPIVHIEKDMFVLADDVLLLLERATMEPLPPKDDKGPQNRTKDGSSGEDFNKDSIVCDEMRLTELGRRTLEIFVLAHIFSNIIEVAYQEAVAFKRQEELIREEEAAVLAELELKAKHGAAEKEKRSKKKQAKQRRSSHKGKDRGKDERSDLMEQAKQERESPSGKRTVDDLSMKRAQPVPQKKDVSDGSDVTETPQPHFEGRDARTANWHTDMLSDNHASTEASSSETSCLPVHNGTTDKKSPSVIDDSSSTCSTDSVPSIVMNGPYKVNSLPDCKRQVSPSSGKRHSNKYMCDQTNQGNKTDYQPSDTATDKGPLHDHTSGSCREDEPQLEAVVLSSTDQINWLEQHIVEKEEKVTSLQRKPSFKDQADVNRPFKQRPAEKIPSPCSPLRSLPSSLQPKQAVEATGASEPVPVRESSSNCSTQTETVPSISKPDVQIFVTSTKACKDPVEKSATLASAVSRPLSVPISAPVPNAHVPSMVQTTSLLAQSASAAGQLGVDLSKTTSGYVSLTQSYKNAVMGSTTCATSSSSARLHSSSSPSPSPANSQHPISPERRNLCSAITDLSFGTAAPELLPNQPQLIGDCIWQDGNDMQFYPTMLNDLQSCCPCYSGGDRSQTNHADEVPAASSAHQVQGPSADEFPHLDIINYLLDEDYSIGNLGMMGPTVQTSNNGNHPLNGQLTFPGDVGWVDVGPSIDYCTLDGVAKYSDDNMQMMYNYSSSLYDGMMDGALHVGLSGYMNGQIDGMIQNQWPADLSLLGVRSRQGDGYSVQLPNYSDMACGINGCTVFRHASGH